MAEHFNPNKVAVANGNIFGFPYTLSEAELVILPVPWEVTTSYGGGTADGPQAILNASTQLDFYDPNLEKAWQYKVAMKEIPQKIYDKNTALRPLAEEYIKRLEEGEIPQENRGLIKIAEHINKECEGLKNWVKEEAKKIVDSGKKVAVLGGDHSTPLGLIEALAEKYSSFSVLQIDAHADLRKAYEGFTYSHASIMYNTLQLPQVSKLVQVGIRDICPDEVEMIINSGGRIKTFFDWDIKNAQYEGKSWKILCDEIIAELSNEVYISFDIDGLDPKLCPNTGTPVVGGLELAQVSYLLNSLCESGKKIIGFDLNEVAPGENEWDANVGARVLYKLCCMLFKSR
ncbi:MAG: agmatinase family protein [Bacteroidetes bacterium]|nr:agmatinase [Bacteroidota bacterium]MBV6461695.1 N(1)-aminopropylagmatine ureohydrolase [Flavobacteriales bacterium]WKZ75098.1 MAG: agmatinase family protein [Vicingaceae bacterium]MCL4815479.1 agmatinase family protein [Flavobacteriales bacterium]NOG96083.1 agmatinase family protein [Bacteroidota bacterium]